MCDTGQGLLGDPILDQAADGGLTALPIIQDPGQNGLHGPLSGPVSSGLPNPLGNEAGCDLNAVVLPGIAPAGL